MQDKKNFSMETAGSLAPQLEGAPHSAGHPRRFSATSAKTSKDQGGNRHP